MILHEYIDVFKPLLRETASDLNLPAVYIEKDYWVTRALKQLSESDISNEIVFKGGTSLSKAHKIINRFSEDVDLAVLNIEQSGNQIKKLLKKTEKTVTLGLTYHKNHKLESKGSVFRKTVYDYPKVTSSNNYGDIKDTILIEVNSFTLPTPYSKQTINSYIGEYLLDKNQEKLIEEYSLHPFLVSVLDVERTLVEKLMGLIKHSYNASYELVLTNKIRHIYDIALILRFDIYKNYLDSQDIIELIHAVVGSEKNIPGKMDKNWLEKPLSHAPLFRKLDNIVPILIKAIHSDSFKDMVFGDRFPNEQEISQLLINVKNTLIKYDRKHNLI